MTEMLALDPPGRIPADQAVREQALDPALCCIVQAPAGSGKTELLIQRLLTLLARVERPEEILAMTFTRKAAGEMRDRVLNALAEAERPLPPGAPAHQRAQHERALAALARDRSQGWHLREQPDRLRIQTIDSLCAALSARLPLSARFGAPLATTETPEDLYREAVTQVLRRIDTPTAVYDVDADALETLLAHLGNNLNRLGELLTGMLARRDQWLRHLGATSAADSRATLESALTQAVEDELGQLSTRLASVDRAELLAVTAQMAAHLAASGVVEPDPRLHWQHQSWPSPGLAGLTHWQGLAALLLTAAGTWKKAPNQGDGVPAKGSGTGAAERDAFKRRVLKLLAQLGQQPGLAEALHAVRTLPQPRYGESDWAVLQALLQLLKLAAAELTLVFAARSEADFIEVARGAITALGEPEAPSEVWLAFDYRIRHILVDEFQDTSQTQFTLLQRLVAGWQPLDAPSEAPCYREAEGRSLFLVGDPMQSIYGFREADVGLFLRARQQGIPCAAGPLRLAPLTLSTNFRSQAGVVDWVNRVFPAVLAEAESASTGAVPYTPSEPWHPEDDGAAVTLQLIPPPADPTVLPGVREAAEVVRLTRAALAEIAAASDSRRPGEGTVAILVRARPHLARILPALRQAGIPFQAVEIEKLSEQPVVKDLTALTRALLHPADRIAWLAVLRAPWCGLSLADLHALAAGPVELTLWQSMHAPERLACLSADGRVRLERLRTALSAGLAVGGRVSLRRQVEGTWLALGGPACAGDTRKLEEAGVLLDLLDTLRPPHTAVQLQRALERLNAPASGGSPAGTAGAVQVMTLHKAKGLQFHTVILPGLARSPRPDPHRLLRWLEHERGSGGLGQTELLLAPIPPPGVKTKADTAALYHWLSRFEQMRTTHEDGRLLYVAATRAIRRLHLLAETPVNGDGEWNPSARSLLGRLWPGLVAAAEPIPAPSLSPWSSPELALRPIPEGAAAAATDTEADPGGPDRPPACLRRLPPDWRVPIPPAGVTVALKMRANRTAVSALSARALANTWQASPAHAEDRSSWNVGDATPRHVGVVVHRLLEAVASEGLSGWDLARLQRHRQAVHRQLTQLGVAGPLRDAAVDRVIQAVTRALEDPRGRWILSPHEHACCEWALSGMLAEAPVNAVVDRSFIADGMRWIIDYKTSEPQATESLDLFLDREQEHYRAQLENYASLIRRLDPQRPIRLGLYFPLLPAWRDWAAEKTE